MKACPLAAANPEQKNSDCLGEACACYIKMHKHRLTHAESSRFVDSEYFYRYTGCGLIAHVPWELVKREKDQKTSTST